MAREAPYNEKKFASWSDLYKAKKAYVCLTGEKWEPGRVLMRGINDREAVINLDRGPNVHIDCLYQVRRGP